MILWIFSRYYACTLFIFMSDCTLADLSKTLPMKVPVLKSVLQKSIRRRRPLPAVRVAMELADKSWGDLIRRLPIIILEDSILHHDFPLLIWLMVADSKASKNYIGLGKSDTCITITHMLLNTIKNEE